MFCLSDPKGPRLCDGWSRRHFLRAGLAGHLVFPFAGSAWAHSTRPLPDESIQLDGRAKACIVLFLMGGPPQHSTWDPKPDAGADIRGAFGPIATKVVGTHFCELLPRSAQHADQIAVLRAVSSGDHAHSSSGFAMLTGRPHTPLNVENANPGPPNDFPTLGAVVQHLTRDKGDLPAAIRLPKHIYNTDLSVWPGQDSGFLGPQSDPWLIRCEPGSAQHADSAFRMPEDVTVARMDRRRSLLRQLDLRLAELDRTNDFAAFDVRQAQAMNVLDQAHSLNAFDLSREPDSVRDRYGRSQFGQSVLLARRLVEAGVSFVHVNWFRGPEEPPEAPVWDSHTNETERLKTVLAPPFDMAFSALLEDLQQTGRLDETLVVVMGEFGRTPKFNARGGRDHWGHVYSMAMAGGGIRGGVVHGASDRQGGYPRDGKVTPADVAATIFDRLGFPPHTEIYDRLDRPFPISTGQPISEILG